MLYFINQYMFNNMYFINQHVTNSKISFIHNKTTTFSPNKH